MLRGRAEPDAVLKGSGIRDPIDLAREAPLWRAALHRALRPLAAMAEAVPENERLTVLAVGSPAISELVPEIAPSPAMEVAALAIDAADRARPEHWLASDRPGVPPARRAKCCPRSGRALVFARPPRHPLPG